MMSLLERRKPIIGMLHLSGVHQSERVIIAMAEMRTMLRTGFDAVMVENYFGSVSDVDVVMGEIRAEAPNMLVGLNILGDHEAAFRLAQKHDADFLQIDSVSGHLPAREDAVFAARLAELRADSGATLLGGARFKYQPVLSGRSESEDAALAAARCDAVVVTGTGTVVETEISKIDRFADALPNGFPLIVGAGLRPDNIENQLRRATGGIIGSWIKSGHKDEGRVFSCYAEEVMRSLTDLRENP